MASRLDITRALHEPGQEFPFRAEVPVEEMEFSGDPVRFLEVVAEGTILGTGERVSVRGEVRGVRQSRCSRCLKEISEPVSTGLDAVFARGNDLDDPDLYSFEASAIDLTDAVRDALVMDIPMVMLCKSDCKGLCPICGADRNLVPCACRVGGEVTNPFAALRSIFSEDEEV